MVTKCQKGSSGQFRRATECGQLSKTASTCGMNETKNVQGLSSRKDIGNALQWQPQHPVRCVPLSLCQQTMHLAASTTELVPSRAFSPHVVKLSPQPQLPLEFGFWKTNSDLQGSQHIAAASATAPQAGCAKQQRWASAQAPHACAVLRDVD